jgi:hypothetical protein
MKTKASGAKAGVRVRLESKALTLSANCPLDHTNPITCPLHDLRRLAEPKRRAWVNGLTLSDLRYLVKYHETCAIERQRALRRRA